VGLAEDLDSRPAPLSMSVADLLEQLDRPDRDAVLRALTDRNGRNFKWSSTALAARLAEDGWHVSHHVIRVWRWVNVPR
jgi:hypothetical protein